MSNFSHQRTLNGFPLLLTVFSFSPPPLSTILCLSSISRLLLSFFSSLLLLLLLLFLLFPLAHASLYPYCLSSNQPDGQFIIPRPAPAPSEASDSSDELANGTNGRKQTSVFGINNIQTNPSLIRKRPHENQTNGTEGESAVDEGAIISC